MKLRFFPILLFACVICSTAGAATDTLSVWSEAMKKNVNVLVVTPDNYNESETEAYPVIYMLHGYGGNNTQWSSLVDLRKVASNNRVIVVCPSAENSWYWDSPVDPSSKYDTFTSKELVKYVDKNYRTIPDRMGRAITGLSMGGHGAFYLALTHKDVYGAMGSTSGGLDIRPFPDQWAMNKLIGDYDPDTNNWDPYTVITKVDNLKNGEFAIIFDCGYDDFFLKVNNDMHNKLLEHKIDHDYIVRPGSHEGPYWSNAINYHILFFRKYFDRNR